MLEEIRINYGLDGQKSPVVILDFKQPVSGAILSAEEARLLAQHLIDAATNAEKIRAQRQMNFSEPIRN
jgi:hypothetical protein